MRFKPPVGRKKELCDGCDRKRYLEWEKDGSRLCEACYYGPVHIKSERVQKRNEDCACGAVRDSGPKKGQPKKFKNCCMPVHVPIEE